MSANFLALQNLLHSPDRSFGQRMPPYGLSLVATPLSQVTPLENVLEEQTVGLGLKYFAPALLPVYQGIEALEDSPNVSPELKQLLEVGEKVIYGVLIYKAIEWLFKQ